MQAKAPNPVDRHVGSRERLRRIMLGMSQERLGEGLRLTFQQIQKYEKGTNRIGASRLQQICDILRIPVSFLFEGVPGGTINADGMIEPASPAYVADFLATAEGLALVRAFTEIPNVKLRRAIVDMVELIGERKEEGQEGQEEVDRGGPAPDGLPPASNRANGRSSHPLPETSACPPPPARSTPRRCSTESGAGL